MYWKNNWASRKWIVIVVQPIRRRIKNGLKKYLKYFWIASEPCGKGSAPTKCQPGWFLNKISWMTSFEDSYRNGPPPQLTFVLYQKEITWGSLPFFWSFPQDLEDLGRSSSNGRPFPVGPPPPRQAHRPWGHPVRSSSLHHLSQRARIILDGIQIGRVGHIDQAVTAAAGNADTWCGGWCFRAAMRAAYLGVVVFLIVRVLNVSCNQDKCNRRWA